mmetsp:Transcript_139902/g.389949  ORF Transcript_139902/g.389949 Transcript_139902/m.389949 type:complete len:223 (+) Transcript_139902:499-1167(+)
MISPHVPALGRVVLEEIQGEGLRAQYLQIAGRALANHLNCHLLHGRLAVGHGGLAGEDQKDVEPAPIIGIRVTHLHAMHGPDTVFVANLLAILVDYHCCLQTEGLVLLFVTAQDAVVEAIVREHLTEHVPHQVLVIVKLPDGEEAHASSFVAVNGVDHLAEHFVHSLGREDLAAVLLAARGRLPGPRGQVLHAALVDLLGGPSVDVADPKRLALSHHDALRQ